MSGREDRGGPVKEPVTVPLAVHSNLFAWLDLYHTLAAKIGSRRPSSLSSRSTRATASHFAEGHKYSSIRNHPRLSCSTISIMRYLIFFVYANSIIKNWCGILNSAS